MALSKSKTKNKEEIVLPSIVDEPKIIEKIVEKYIFIHKTASNVSSNSYTVPLCSKKPGQIGGKSISFGLTFSPTGCGLGLFSGFTYSANGKLSKEEREKFVICLKGECETLRFYCLIATLGDTYISKTSTPTNYEDFLSDLGFKEIHCYGNLCHGTGYNQKIYKLDINDLK